MRTSGGGAHLELSRAGRLARVAELLRLGRTEHALGAIEALRADALADEAADAQPAAEAEAALEADATGGVEWPGGTRGAEHLRAASSHAGRGLGTGAETAGFSAALQSEQFSEDELVARALHALAT